MGGFVRRSSMFAMLVWVFGCTFDGSGSTGTGSLGMDGSEENGGESGPSATSGNDTTASTSAGSGSHTTGATSDPSTDTTDDPTAPSTSTDPTGADRTSDPSTTTPLTSGEDSGDDEDTAMQDTGMREPERWGACPGGDDDECAYDDEVCVPLYSSGSIVASWCASSPCAMHSDCPDPAGGTAQKRCSQSAHFCVLDCSNNASCPPGMECILVSLGPNNYASRCAWPK